MSLYASTTISLEELINNLGDSVAIASNDMVFRAINKNFAKFYGVEPEVLIGKRIFDIYPDFKNSVFYEGAEETQRTGKSVTRIGYSNNAKNWIVVRTAKYDDTHTIWSTHLLKEDLKSSYISSFDNLTSIQNRFGLEVKLTTNIEEQSNFTIFLIDILKFRSVNESFGVTQGDMILMEFAARIKTCLGKDITLYRYNADQFAVILDTIEPLKVEETIKNIHFSKNKSFLAMSNHITLDLAVGYCSVQTFDHNFQEIMNHAEMALGKAKKTKNKLAVQFDEKENCRENKNKIILANELKKAFKENNGLVLYYQRQVDCMDKKICGAEALIRWNHPTKGMIYPDQFLKVAEEFDLMFDLDKFVFIRAIKELYFLTQNSIELPISINLSSASLCNPKIIDLMQAALSIISINPALITIEITESAFIEEKQMSRKIVEGIKALGMNIALDDFGTGYSSMEYLLSYPADYLKIDREFIRNVNEDSQRKKIVKGLIIMAQSLNMSVVAEGVENKEEAEVLDSFNCNCIQGYYYGKPQKLEDLIFDIKKNGYSNSKGKIRVLDRIEVNELKILM